jgi:hypothetical protein
MNGGAIDDCVARVPHLRRSYYGTFPADALDPPKKFPASCIINHDKEAEIGSHWVACWMPDNSRVMYFDSLGNPPPIGEIRNFLFRNFSEVYFNTRPLQEVISSACGPFCLYFLYYATQNVPFERIISIFQSMPDDDQAVTDWTNKTLGTNYLVVDPASFV